MSPGLLLLSLTIISFVVFNIWAFLAFRFENDSETKSILHILGSIFVPTIVAVTTSFLLMFLTNDVDINCKTITEIGGCNYRTCGVKLNDGTIMRFITPVLGQTVCETKMEWK